MSDLHLEVGHQYSSFCIPKTAPYLVLAGDIGRLADYESYRVFLRSQCQQFTRVFLVLGKHEFYGLSREEGLQRAKLLEQEPELNGKLVILSRTRVTLTEHPGIIILGCTLQSRILSEARDIVKSKVKDFQRIKDWTVDDHLREHALDADWLEMQIRDIRNQERTAKHRVLVISHHPPCVQESSRPGDAGTPWSSAFGTDLLGHIAMSALSDVQVWIFGHAFFYRVFERGCETGQQSTRLCYFQKFHGGGLVSDPLSISGQETEESSWRERLFLSD
jgi:hypothetical protein